MRPRPEFPTPQMQAVDRELDARIDFGLAQARELRDTMDRLDREEAEAAAADAEDEPAELPDADALKTIVTGHAMTPEWRTVVERIDRGTLSWDEVLATLRSGTADEQVTAAFQSLTTVAPPTPEELFHLGLGPDPTEEPDDSTDDQSART